jgi:hypothetical protein
VDEVIEPLQVSLAAILEYQPRSGHEISHGGRYQHLAGSGVAGNASADVYGDPAQLAVRKLAFAGMHASADIKPIPRRASTTAKPHRTARAGPSKDARKPSPAVSTSRPR